MLTRWLAGAIAVTAFALVARPTAGQARRGVEMTLTQRSHALATFRFVTSCSAAIGGLQCAPLPKEAPRP